VFPNALVEEGPPVANGLEVLDGGAKAFDGAEKPVLGVLNALLLGKPTLPPVENALLKAGLAAADGYGLVNALNGFDGSYTVAKGEALACSALSGLLKFIVKAFGAAAFPEMNGLAAGF
jgi:hypothetical protein